MKKIISIFICTILCTVFSISAFASLEETETSIVNVNFNSVSSDFDSVPAFAVSAHNGKELGDTPYHFSFAQSRDNGSGITWYYTAHFILDDFVYDADTQTISKSDGSYFDFYYTIVAVEDSNPEDSAGISYGNVHAKSIKFKGSFDEERFKQNTNMHIKNLERFDPNMPPDVFLYNINPSPFTLDNYNGDNGIVNVTISYTAEYLDWFEKLHERFPDVSGAYNFIIYVSPERASDTNSLIRSLNRVSYIKLFYGEYVYEGGVGYAYLSEENTDAYMSQSGKSPYTQAQGVHICCTLDPTKNTELVVPIKTENIKGFNEHTDGYIYVLGAYSSGNVSPNDFNAKVLDGALSGHSTPNDTFSEFFDTHTEDENSVPDYSMHTYFMPFDYVFGAKGDLYQGNCTYKEQSINGKTYDTSGKVTDFTNKSIAPDVVHDVDMSPSEWVKYEDYPKWQYDYYQRNKYDDEFDFNTQTFKDVFDKEGDFFKFIGSVFSVFPSYVMTIFVAFLVCMLVIVLLKFIL